MIVIDVGAWQVRGARILKAKAGTTTVCDERSYEVGSVLDGPLVRTEALAEAVELLVEEIAETEKGVGPDVLVGISLSLVAVFRARARVALAGAKVSDRDVERAEQELVRQCAPGEDAELIHALETELVLDGARWGRNQIVRRSGSELRASRLVVHAPQWKVEAIRRGCEAARAKRVRVVANPVVAGYGLLTEQERMHGAVIIDLGATETMVTVWKRGLPMGVGAIPGGGMALTSAIAAALDLDLPRADALKRSSGVCGAGEVDDYAVRLEGGARISRAQLAAVVDRELEHLLLAVREMVTGAVGPSAVRVLTGGGAMLQGIDRFTERVHGAPARLGFFSSPVSTLGFGQPSRATLGALIFLGGQKSLLRTLVAGAADDAEGGGRKVRSLLGRIFS
jgi:cell division protein FtsA